MGEHRRRFSDEFKREAVRLAYESGRRLVDVARELDVRPNLIRRWRRKLTGGQGPVGSGAELEVRRLQRELSLVREERDILKKALAIFSDRRRLATRGSSGSAPSIPPVGSAKLWRSRAAATTLAAGVQSRPGCGKIASSSARSSPCTRRSRAATARRASSARCVARAWPPAASVWLGCAASSD